MKESELGVKLRDARQLFSRPGEENFGNASNQ